MSTEWNEYIPKKKKTSRSSVLLCCAFAGENSTTSRADGVYIPGFYKQATGNSNVYPVTRAIGQRVPHTPTTEKCHTNRYNILSGAGQSLLRLQVLLVVVAELRDSVSELFRALVFFFSFPFLLFSSHSTPTSLPTIRCWSLASRCCSLVVRWCS
jgi:hypothetical protein